MNLLKIALVSLISIQFHRSQSEKLQCDAFTLIFDYNSHYKQEVA
jgi:hypothetical protein